MRAATRKWGNSVAVRIPAAVMQATHLDVDEAVDVREESGCIVIEPVRRKEHDLEEMVKRITRRNLPEEVDFGGRAGSAQPSITASALSRDTLT